MIIGTDRERKIDAQGREIEWRVGVTPGAVQHLVAQGHECLVETGAGLAAGFTDSEYARAGAEIVGGQQEIYGRAELIYKVKEPQEAEWDLFRPGQILFTYIHSAGRRAMLDALLEHRVVAVAFEDVRTADGRLPMLEPMSIFAGHVAQQKGYQYLLCDGGNVGILSGHMTGIEPAKVCVLGTGSAGEAALRVAWGMGSRVVALYHGNFVRAQRIERSYRGVTCLQSTPDNVARALEGTHILNNCMTWPIDRRDELLVSTAQLASLDDHAVVVDVSAELLGGLESTRGVHTSHDDPVVRIADKIHYVVPNVPAIAARSASLALVNSTLPWACKLAAGWSWDAATTDDPLRRGLTCAGGQVHEPLIKSWYESGE